MKLTNVIAIWDILHVKDTGDMGFHELDSAIEQVVGINNDIPKAQPYSFENNRSCRRCLNYKEVRGD